MLSTSPDTFSVSFLSTFPDTFSVSFLSTLSDTFSVSFLPTLSDTFSVSFSCFDGFDYFIQTCITYISIPFLLYSIPSTMFLSRRTIFLWSWYELLDAGKEARRSLFRRSSLVLLCTVCCSSLACWSSQRSWYGFHSPILSSLSSLSFCLLFHPSHSVFSFISLSQLCSTCQTSSLPSVSSLIRSIRLFMTQRD